jgi:hypothetical protein
VDGVKPGARGYIADTAIEKSELGGDIIGLGCELFDIVEYGEEGDLTGFGLEGGDAVKEVFVGPRATSDDAWKNRNFSFVTGSCACGSELCVVLNLQPNPRSAYWCPSRVGIPFASGQPTQQLLQPPLRAPYLHASSHRHD